MSEMHARFQQVVDRDCVGHGNAALQAQSVTGTDRCTAGAQGRIVGKVDRAVVNEGVRGKVVIGSTEWSARSTGATIPAGKKVKVVSSQGVHIVVEEVV